MLDYLATAQNSSTDRTDNYVVARLGFEFRFSRHMVGNAFYQFRTLDSNQSDGFSNNQVGLQLAFLY